jgi:monooxygenase
VTRQDAAARAQDAQQTADSRREAQMSQAAATRNGAAATHEVAQAAELAPEPRAADGGHVDVLIIGAGLSGIGAACYLQRHCPDKSFAILEAREAIGGTWDLFRYPGIRSDSDMFTLGYSFRPWADAQAIADGPSIRRYIRDTAREHELEPNIRFGHRALRAEFSSADGRWGVEVERADTGERVRMTCGFLYACTGYYRYDEGYTPDFPGIERFGGRLIHPQHWPKDLDYAGKRVLVIGSGATAVTLVPAMAEQAEHVTMLQRSPTYVVSLPGRDPLAERLRRWLPPRLTYPVVRWKNVLMMMLTYRLSRRWPNFVRGMIRKGTERRLPPGYEVDVHFNPRYEPWDQRMCLVPDGDLFEAISAGRASIVTDSIKSFTPSGVELASGEQLDADVIITATGLNLLALGGLELTVDGREIELSQTVGYKGMMLSGVPNFAMTLGYTNASWTLKADLVARYVCRLLSYMDEHGYAMCVPQAPEASQPTEPWLNLKSGYVLRSVADLPKQGNTPPWKLHQNYLRDIPLLKRSPLDEAMSFSRARERAAAAPRPSETEALAA